MTREEMRKLLEDQPWPNKPPKIETLRKALHQLLEETEWCPIETAPKDGTEIFIWRENWDFAPLAFWGNLCPNEYPDGWVLGDGVYCGGNEDGFLGWDDDPMPTHWWPAPPKGEDDGR